MIRPLLLLGMAAIFVARADAPQEQYLTVSQITYNAEKCTFGWTIMATNAEKEVVQTTEYTLDIHARQMSRNGKDTIIFDGGEAALLHQLVTGLLVPYAQISTEWYETLIKEKVPASKIGVSYGN